ncbi:hypothetical protein E4U51_000107 [Claviceps purpurea]|nr:hypothetical protein E4U51_000107 [Claviceps purpurea]
MAKTNIQTPQEHCEYSDTPRTLTVEEEYYKAPTSKEEHKSIPQGRFRGKMRRTRQLLTDDAISDSGSRDESRDLQSWTPKKERYPD